MSGLLSGLTSQVTGPLVLGLLPTTTFPILLGVFAVPLAPERLAFFERFGMVAAECQAVG